MGKGKRCQQERNRGQFPGRTLKTVTTVGLVLALLVGLGCLLGGRALGAEAAKKRRPVEFRADHMSGKEDVWTLKDNVVFVEKDEEITLKADQAVYWSKEDRAEITGNISVTDPEHSGTSDVVKADFSKKVIFFEANVKVERTPKEAKQAGENEEEKFTVEEAKKKKSTITCDKVEYDYDKHFLVANGNVKIVQEKRTATCQKAEYDEDKEILTIAEGVRIEDTDGNWFECSRAVINTDTDTVEASDITGVYFYEEEQKPAETPETAAPETVAPETAPPEAAPAAPEGESPPPGQ